MLESETVVLNCFWIFVGYTMAKSVIVIYFVPKTDACRFMSELSSLFLMKNFQ